MNSDVITKPIDISKELEALNFKELSLRHPQLKNKKNKLLTIITKAKAKKWAWRRNKNRVLPETKGLKKAKEPQTQLAAFRDAMKLLLIIGQSLGLNPVRGILEADVSEMRFQVFSWRYLYCFLIGSAQAIATILCLYRLHLKTISIGPLDISKELEALNFKELSLRHPQLKNKKNKLLTIITKAKAKKWAWRRNKNRVLPETKGLKKAKEPQTQLAAFQDAMKLLLIIGQSLGLNPVRGILEADVSEMRFQVLSWRYLYCFLIGSAQAIATILCLYRLHLKTLSIGPLAFICFYGATCVTTFIFIQIGAKWSKLMKDIAKSELDEYIDHRVKSRCNLATIIMVTFAIVEHILSILYKAIEIVKCYPDENYYDHFLRRQFPWIFDLNVPVYISLGVFLQILNLSSTINWNYSDLCIICMSMYLASILNKINEKVISASQNHHLPSSEWKTLREDYTKATKLVRSFDDIFSGIIFCSFASNLFFICLQLFNILAYGVSSSQRAVKLKCPKLPSGSELAGNEYSLYLMFSTMYLFGRSLAVSLVTASVNTASLVPAPALYNVPSAVYCEEVSRFIEQVHANTVALSGLQFFYVTRELVLSVAGTIVTYELVLLQFSNI